MNFRALVRPVWPSNRTRSVQMPIGSNNGKIVGSWQQGTYEQRFFPTRDFDFTQRLFRRYVDASGAQSVQFSSGLEWGRFQGRKTPAYHGAGWYWAAQPVIPGQMRGNYGGFYPSEPSIPQLMAIIQGGPGSQPQTPAGTMPPGGIAGPDFDNPMTG